MITEELNEATRAFVAANRERDVRELALHAKPGEGVDLTAALEQIAGWRTARTKLPEWAACGDVWYPPHLSMEQCSSEATARYKAALARRVVAGSTDATAAGSVDASGSSGPAGSAVPLDAAMVDLTGGFGVDCSYMAREFAHAVYVERQERLCALASHNMRALGLDHVRVVHGDAQDAARGMDPVSLIFLDPARRDARGARTYAIADCTPDVLGMLDVLLAKAPHLMVKLSPMLDWHKTVADFRGHVAEVHVVSTGNECKELLLVVCRDVTDDPLVVCVNDASRLEFRVSQLHGDDPAAETPAVPANGVPEDDAPACEPERARHLYEPNASVMKAGCFTLLERRFGVREVGPNSHLFVSGRPVEGFPGRAFDVEAVGTLNKRDVRRLTEGLTHANVATRNFPMAPEALRRKLKLKDGGDVYLFAATAADGRRLVFRTRKP